MYAKCKEARQTQRGGREWVTAHPFERDIIVRVFLFFFFPLLFFFFWLCFRKHPLFVVRIKVYVKLCDTTQQKAFGKKELLKTIWWQKREGGGGWVNKKGWRWEGTSVSRCVDMNIYIWVYFGMLSWPQAHGHTVAVVVNAGKPQSAHLIPAMCPIPLSFNTTTIQPNRMCVCVFKCIKK